MASTYRTKIRVTQRKAVIGGVRYVRLDIGYGYTDVLPEVAMVLNSLAGMKFLRGKDDRERLSSIVGSALIMARARYGGLLTQGILCSFVRKKHPRFVEEWCVKHPEARRFFPVQKPEEIVEAPAVKPHSSHPKPSIWDGVLGAERRSRKGK